MNIRNNRRLLWYFGFALYLGLLIYFLLFAEMFGRDMTDRSYSYNVEPFREIARFVRYRHKLGFTAVVLNLAGNIAVFIPFGIFVPVLFKPDMRLWQTVFTTMAASLIIEILQLVFRVGSFDVDDILLNTVGGLIGAWIYCTGRRRNGD